MALRVWLPLNGTLENQGLSDVTVTNNGSTPNSEGKIGSCYENTANGNGILLTNYMNELKTYSAYSMCAWIYMTEPAGGHSSSILSSGNWNTTNGNLCFGFYTYNEGYNRLLIPNKGGWATNIYIPEKIVIGKWYHVAITYDGSKTSAYINGAFIASSTTGGICENSNSPDLKIGAATYTTGFTLKGKINDVRIYDHALSTKEVKEVSMGLIAHYKLADGYAGTVTNLLPPGHYNTTTGASWGKHYAVNTIEPTTGNVPFSACNKIVVTVTGTTGAGGYGTGRATVNCSADTDYMYSVYISPEDDFAYTHPNFMYRYEYSGNTRVHETGIFNTANTEYIGDGWYRAWGTFTTTSAATKVNVSFFTYPGKDITYYVGGTMLELGNKLHPFTTGTVVSSVMADSSGYKRDGEYMGTVQGVISDGGRYGTAINVSSGYVGMAQVDIPPLSAITFAWWGKYSAFGPQNSGMFACSSGATSPTDYLTSTCNQRDTQFDICNLSGTKKALNAAGMTSCLNNWHHFCVTYNGTTLTFYIDGVASSTNTQTGALRSAPYLYIGYSMAGGLRRMPKGDISDFRVYCTALSADDVMDLYRNSASVDNKGNLHCYEIKEV